MVSVRLSRFLDSHRVKNSKTQSLWSIPIYLATTMSQLAHNKVLKCSSFAWLCTLLIFIYKTLKWFPLMNYVFWAGLLGGLVSQIWVTEQVMFHPVVTVTQGISTKNTLPTISRRCLVMAGTYFSQNRLMGLTKLCKTIYIEL